MKTVKKIMLAFLAVLVLSAAGAYTYFDQKFTPEENYLTVENESGLVPFTWLGTEKNAVLLPIHFLGDSTTYYLQLDTGSPYTVLYAGPIKNISQIAINEGLGKASFYIGKTKITSDAFKIYNKGKESTADSLKIIGTLGADILENRKTLLNFKENYIALNLADTPVPFQGKLFDFVFNKRKIIVQGILNNKEEKFVLDSGTSAYELLTSKEEWEKLKLPDSKVHIQKSQSWDRVLTTYTAHCNQKIQFGTREIPLRQVTYVEGVSQAQYAMMKQSGMTGMLGNRIFLSNSLYMDCTENKMGID